MTKHFSIELLNFPSPEPPFNGSNSLSATTNISQILLSVWNIIKFDLAIAKFSFHIFSFQVVLPWIITNATKNLAKNKPKTSKWGFFPTFLPITMVSPTLSGRVVHLQRFLLQHHHQRSRMCSASESKPASADNNAVMSLVKDKGQCKLFPRVALLVLK